MANMLYVKKVHEKKKKAVEEYTGDIHTFSRNIENNTIKVKDFLGR